MGDNEELQKSKENDMVHSEDSTKLTKNEKDVFKIVENKLNNFIKSSDESLNKVPRELKKIKRNGEEYDFSCSIDEVRTNWRGVEKEDRRKCYVKVLKDKLILDKTGIMVQSDLGSRTIYFSDISSVDFDKSGVLHVTNSVKLIMRGGEFITLIHVGQMEYDLINAKWKDYKENQHNTETHVMHQPTIQEVHKNTGKTVSNVDELMKYAELYERGLLTKEEFEMKKSELLGNPSVEENKTGIQNENYSLKQEFVENDVSSNNGPKFCPNCGTPVVDDSKFCTNCGNKL